MASAAAMPDSIARCSPLNSMTSTRPAESRRRTRLGVEVRQRMPAAFGHQPRAVFDGPAAGDVPLHERMPFPAAEQFVGDARRIAVVRGPARGQGPRGWHRRGRGSRRHRRRNRAGSLTCGAPCRRRPDSAGSRRLPSGRARASGDSCRAARDAARQFAVSNPAGPSARTVAGASTVSSWVATPAMRVAVPDQGVGGLAGHDVHAEIAGDLGPARGRGRRRDERRPFMRILGGTKGSGRMRAASGRGTSRGRRWGPGAGKRIPTA